MLLCAYCNIDDAVLTSHQSCEFQKVMVVVPIPEETEVQVVKFHGTLDMSKFTSRFNGRIRI